MGFESIDVVAFGMAIEEHYKQAFPFAEFLAAVGQREALPPAVFHWCPE